MGKKLVQTSNCFAPKNCIQICRLQKISDFQFPRAPKCGKPNVSFPRWRLKHFCFEGYNNSILTKTYTFLHAFASWGKGVDPICEISRGVTPSYYCWWFRNLANHLRCKKPNQKRNILPYQLVRIIPSTVCMYHLDCFFWIHHLPIFPPPRLVLIWPQPLGQPGGLSIQCCRRRDTVQGQQNLYDILHNTWLVVSTHLKKYQSNWISFRVRDENQKCLKPKILIGE